MKTNNNACRFGFAQRPCSLSLPKGTMRSLACILLATMLTLSCSTNEQNGGNQTDSNQSYDYCITSDKACLIGPFTKNTCNGQPSNSCPYGTSSPSVGSSSSSSSRPSSSSYSVQCTNTKGSGTFADSRDSKTYKYVTICNQTWMAENLNYNVTGSKCYDNLENNCDKYGRLYDWSTAMNLPSTCNSSTCASQVQAKHRGICPEGWHIPTNAEWNELYHYANGTLDGSTNLSSNYYSPTAGKHLKAKEGWTNCSASGSSYSCLDTHGFAALPGGLGLSDGYFGNAGSNGRWWSSTEYSANSAYSRYMYYDLEGANWNISNKSYLLSVRCVED